VGRGGILFFIFFLEWTWGIFGCGSCVWAESGIFFIGRLGWMEGDPTPKKVILVALSLQKKVSSMIGGRSKMERFFVLASMRPMNTLLRICGCSDSFPPVTLSPCLLFPMFPSPVPLLSVFVRGCFCLFRLFHSPPWLVNHFWSPRSALPQVHLLK